MKYVLAFTAAALAFLPAAFAADVKTEISCKTDRVIEKGHPTEIHMVIVNLEKGKLGWDIARGGDDENPIVTNPKDTILDINDNLEMIRKDDGNLLVKSDGDGEQDTHLELYKDKGFKSGFVRLAMHTGGDDKGAYSPLTCTVK
jgi:hypothetical protein